MFWTIFGLVAALSVILAVATVVFLRMAICRNDSYTLERALARMEKTTPPQQFALIKEGVARFEAEKKQDVYITSRDGLRLHAYLFEQENPAAARGTIVLVHGWRSHPQLDFSASRSSYLEKGLNVLAIHQRAHGLSEGKFICFGVKERFDLLDWLAFVSERYGADHKIITSGISMGSATVLMALGEESFPRNVVGATADCGFTSPWDQFIHVLRHTYHLPKFPLLYTTDLLSRAVADFPFRACSTVESLKKSRTPLLILHGLADDFVPPEHSRQNAAACASPCELIEVEGAGHGMSYLVDPETVKPKLDEFLDRILA